MTDQKISDESLQSSSPAPPSSGIPSAPSLTSNHDDLVAGVTTCIQFLARWLHDNGPLPAHLSRKKKDREMAAFICMRCAATLGGKAATLSFDGREFTVSLESAHLTEPAEQQNT